MAPGTWHPAPGTWQPGSQHDRINFTGSGLFEAQRFLRVALIGGFVPQAGNRFALFSCAQSPVGNFEDFDLPALTAGLLSFGHLRTGPPAA